ncbi:MAG: NAD(P)H-dependent oxidoreductase [Oscillospiraceae bacterium]|nr:NAD(P)H-dependent oxidoreductase [Oscillospiraceae bacterium]
MKQKAKRPILLLILAFALLAGCGAAPRSSEAAESPAAAGPETSAGTAPAEAAAGTPEAAETEIEADTAPEGPKITVAVFSCTGHTRRIAQVIAEGLGAELQEIVPAEPYTEDDLRYNDSAARATAEQNDPAARPAMAGEIEGLEDCDVLFLGYPIWWGQEPRILDTFLETYDLTGITVAPFCTSGSSGIGTSVRQLSAIAEGADWTEGRRFAADAPEDEINSWAAEILAAAE